MAFTKTVGVASEVINALAPHLNAIESLYKSFIEKVQQSEAQRLSAGQAASNPTKLVPQAEAAASAKAIEAAEGVAVASGENTVKTTIAPEKILEECIGGIGNGTKNRGVTTVYEKNGGYTTTLSDFWRVKPSNVKPFSTPKCSGLTGTLPDGRTITARTYSSDGRPTLEIINSQHDYIAIRYNE